MGRFKTGTPPRLARDSVDLSRFEEQPGDAEPAFFSTETNRTALPQVPCHLAYTNEHVHGLVRDNLDRSPMFTGRIQVRGPRYCPSLEDKVVRFEDRERHLLYLEPEGLDSSLIYVNGFSTSLPADVQESMIRAVEGLHDCEIVRPGYAVEYDYVDPSECRATLETRRLPGLYLAGQINGTTGYEEAAALGLVAGANAALAAKGASPFVVERDEGYIGVLVDDLVTRGTSEPYRMFTSRAEYRLLLGVDSATRRLSPKGEAIGLLDAARAAREAARWQAVAGAIEMAERERLPREVHRDWGEASRTTSEWLRRHDLDPAPVAAASPALSVLSARDRKIAIEEIQVRGYVERQRREAARVARAGKRRIPEDFRFAELAGLSLELQEKLERVRPETLGHASRIDGMTPAAIALLAAHLERQRERAAG